MYLLLSLLPGMCKQIMHWKSMQKVAGSEDKDILWEERIWLNS